MIHLWRKLSVEAVRPLAKNSQTSVFGIGNQMLADACQSLIPHFEVDRFFRGSLEILLDEIFYGLLADSPRSEPKDSP
jgi:hypothetical protein